MDLKDGLTYVLKEIMEKVKSMSESWPFMKPVNRKAMKHYYDMIKQPMDLSTMSTKLEKQQYHSRQEFLDDFELIYNNRFEAFTLVTKNLSSSCVL